MKAKYPSTCAATGKQYPAGTEIEKGPRGWQIAGATPQDRTTRDGETRVARGEGYGGTPYREGETFIDKSGQLITVRVAWSQYYREDGLSFGVGDDSGHIYYAICRPATEDEAAPVKAAIAAQEARRQARAEFKRLFEIEEGEYIHTGERIHLVGEWVKLDMGFTIYGGGEEICIAADGASIWRVRGNGADGDDWSLSNTTAGIGYRFEATPERLAVLNALRNA